MLPTDLLPYVVDELTAYDNVGEMTDACKTSSLSRMFGSVAHKARVGRTKIQTDFLNILKADGHIRVLMGELLHCSTAYEADDAQHSPPFDSEIRGEIVRSGAYSL